MQILNKPISNDVNLALAQHCMWILNEEYFKQDNISLGEHSRIQKRENIAKDPNLWDAQMVKIVYSESAEIFTDKMLNCKPIRQYVEALLLQTLYKSTPEPWIFFSQVVAIYDEF